MFIVGTYVHMSNAMRLVRWTKVVFTGITARHIVRWLRGRKHHNCSFCDKRTIFTGSSPFNMTIHIRYGGISEINPDS